MCTRNAFVIACAVATFLAFGPSVVAQTTDGLLAISIDDQLKQEDSHSTPVEWWQMRVMRLGHFNATSNAPLPQQLRLDPPGTGRLLVGGLIGAGGGFLLGGIIGAALAPSGDSWLGMERGGYFLMGGSLGEFAALPIGVHIANNGRGDLGHSMLLSAGTMAAGWLMTIAIDHPAPLAAVLPVQLVLTINAERQTAEPRF